MGLYVWVGLSFLIGLVGSWLFGWISEKTGWLNHRTAVPRGGGIVFYLPFILWTLTSYDGYKILWGAGTLLFIFGFFDDLRSLNPWVKLGFQVLVAAFTWFAGFRFGSLDLGFWSLQLPTWADFALTAFFLVGIMNAFNLLDGIDGVAAIQALVGFSAVLYFAILAEEPLVSRGAGMMAATVAGFLFFNTPPARLYMGDLGSHFLGYLVGVLALRALRTDSGVMLLPLALLVALPVVDTLLAILRRLRKRVSVFKGDEEHIHHQLRRRLGPKGALYALSGIIFALGIGAALSGFWPLLGWALVPSAYLALFAWGVSLKSL